ncbi:MAG: leucine-rich repeat domain-containing protein [Kiritimatiellae bacterium]|nr:leucine-rich repeat domain-containing protein [Kiritimatiellia bacterium]
MKRMMMVAAIAAMLGGTRPVATAAMEKNDLKRNRKGDMKMMMKLLVAGLLATVTANVFSVTLYTNEVDGVKWVYSVSDGKATLGGGDAASSAIVGNHSGKVEIPSFLGETPVVAIANYAFNGNVGIKDLIVPEGITSIGDYAFQGCGGLTELILPEGLVTIGSYAFANCGNLVSVTVPTTLVQIDGFAFSGCNDMERVNAKSLSAWCRIAFGNGRANPLYIDTNPQNGVLFFVNGVEVHDLVIPEDVTTLKRWAFFFCQSITSVTMHDGVTDIEKSAFNNCWNLTNVTFSANLKTIASYAFSCSKMTDIYIPGSVDSIGYRAFDVSQSLTNLVIGGGVKSIESCAFIDAKQLLRVVLPTSLTSFSTNAFSGCTVINEVTVPTDHWTMRQFFPDAYADIVSASVSPGSVSIRDSAFEKCGKLRSVLIADTVSTIGGNAFRDCTAIESLDIPALVSEIAEDAFRGCSSILAITVDDDNLAFKSIDGVLFTT